MRVNNKIIAFFWNKLDVPIRFFYCRLPFLNKLLFWKLYSSDIKKLDSQFEKLKKILAQNNFSLKDKICLEIGPGNSYLNAYNLLMNGAQKVFLIDKFPRNFSNKKQIIFFQKEISFIKKKYKKEKLFFINDNKINKKYIEFIIGDVTQYKFKNKFDLIISISVLEHIKDIKEFIFSLSKIIKPKGLMYHYIDLRDHYNFNNPFLFYRYPQKIWEKYLTREGISYTNRLRYCDYLAIFKKYNFKIIRETKKSINIPQYIKISKDFSNYSKNNLKITEVAFLLKSNN